MQPHQTKVSSGDSGGGNESGWGENDKEKNKYKPRAYEKLEETVGADSTLTVFKKQLKAVRETSGKKNK